MKKEYRNVLKTKKQIREAVISLINKKKDITLISITDIIKTADISRSTFYNHYTNVTDVIGEIEDQLILQLTETLEESITEDNTIKSFMTSITKYLKQNEMFYHMVVPYIPKYILERMKKRFLKEITKIYKIKEDLEKTNVMLDIIANGIAGLYMDYFEGRVDITLDEISKYSIEFLEKVM